MAWLLDEQGGAMLHAKLLEDGRWVGIHRLAFHYSLMIGTVGDYVGYDDRYCYQHLGLVLRAFADFDGEVEPLGWHRNPRTGRRRPDGNPEQEYIEW